MSPETEPIFVDETRTAALCVLTVDEWARTLVDLLPRGVVWPREPGTIQEAFFMAIGTEMRAVQTRDCDLLAESFPCTGADELLPEWENMTGLPDECTESAYPLPLPLEVRQRFVCAKLASQGGQSIEFFENLARLYGFDITIIEHFPWRMGCTTLCDARPGGCQFWWQVYCPNIPTPPGPAVLECIIRRAAPAHSIVTFVYAGEAARWDWPRWNIDNWSLADGATS